jgi:hypothetical protein
MPEDAAQLGESRFRPANKVRLVNGDHEPAKTKR